MNDRKIILVMNGASSSDVAPNYLSIVQKQGEAYHLLAEEKTTLKGGPERFPIYFQSFIQQNIISPDQIDLIGIMVGPGSFTGLRASIAFALGLQLGLQCPIIGLRRGEVLFPFLEQDTQAKLIWHVTQARRGRIFVETNQSEQVVAYDEKDLTFPTEAFMILGEAVQNFANQLPSNAYYNSDYCEADALMMAQIADKYQQHLKTTNKLYPLYVDPPEAKLPQKGLRKAPV